MCFFFSKGDRAGAKEFVFEWESGENKLISERESGVLAGICFRERGFCGGGGGGGGGGDEEERRGRWARTWGAFGFGIYLVWIWAKKFLELSWE